MRQWILALIALIIGLTFYLSTDNSGRRDALPESGGASPDDVGTIPVSAPPNPEIATRDASDQSFPTPSQERIEFQSRALSKRSSNPLENAPPQLHHTDSPQPDSHWEIPDQEPSDERKVEMLFSVDREGIQGAIQELSPQVRECYEGWLKTDSALEGRVTISFTIDHAEPLTDEDGTTRAVQYAEIRDTHIAVDEVRHTMMTGCVLNSMSELKFDNVESPVVVNFPFHFSSGAEE
jgi:hypothetical protein